MAVKVKIRGRQVEARVWLCTKYDNAPLYLLDTNLPDNPDSLLTDDDQIKWAEMMRASVKMSQWKFSAARLVEDYYKLMYAKT